MNKLFLISLGILLITFTGSYLIASNIYTKDRIIDLDGNFDRVLEEVESYGGAMIVSYDTETGEITGKRRVGEQKQAGVMSITQKEYEQSNKAYPIGTLIAPHSLTPQQAIEYIGGNNLW